MLKTVVLAIAVMANKVAFCVGLVLVLLVPPVVSAAEPGRVLPVQRDVEALKQEILALNRDLRMLQEELLYPAASQVTIFLSLDIGAYFRLSQVKLKVDDQVVAETLYTEGQVDSLARGGVQRLYIGNLTAGSHDITAFFTGVGTEGRSYKRGATVKVIKRDVATVLELQINDSTANQQPAFSVRQWAL
jgi:hypothetical protein